METYFVYILFDRRKPGKCRYESYEFEYEPFYIGISKRKSRPHDHFKYSETTTNFKVSIIKKIMSSGWTPADIIQIFKTGLTKDSAIELEINLIKTIGRRCYDNGPLVNLTDGGEGMFNPSPSLRKRLSIARTGENNHFFGKHHTHETKDRIRDTIGNSRVGELNNNYNKKWTPEQKAIASKRQKENHIHLTGENNPSKRQEVREKISAKLSGKNNPRYKDWELVTPTGSVIILPGGAQLKVELSKFNLTKAMFHKQQGSYRVQKDGYKLKSIQP